VRGLTPRSSEAPTALARRAPWLIHRPKGRTTLATHLQNASAILVRSARCNTCTIPQQAPALCLLPSRQRVTQATSSCCRRGGGRRIPERKARATSRHEAHRQACRPPTRNRAPESNVPSNRPAALAM